MEEAEEEDELDVMQGEEVAGSGSGRRSTSHVGLNVGVAVLGPALGHAVLGTNVGV